tara:strand:- start:1505 stop:2140 length:636 start_codon:yes stop_codon:yes gene_type:complete
MKLDIKSIVILVLAIYVGYNFFYTTPEVIKDVSVITDAKVGEVSKKVDSIIRDTIYIEVKVPGKKLPRKKVIVVDSLYKKQYEDAIKDNDSLKAKNLFLESIALDTWKGTLINNKDIKITGEFLTRGKMLEYDVKYDIKPDTITYTPEVIYRYPRASVTLGVDVMSPGVTATSPIIIPKIGFTNSKGHTFSGGYSSDKKWVIGYSKTFKLF